MAQPAAETAALIGVNHPDLGQGQPELFADEPLDDMDPCPLVQRVTPPSGSIASNARSRLQLGVADPDGGVPVLENHIRLGKPFFDISGPKLIVARDIGGFRGKLGTSPVMSQLSVHN